MGKVFFCASLFAILLMGFIQSVCLAESVSFGPKTYTVGSSLSLAVTEHFPSALNGGRSFLRIDNGNSSGQYRVTTGHIYLNGSEVITPSDLNSQIGLIEIEVDLQGENELIINLGGKKGSFIALSINDGDPQPPGSFGSRYEDLIPPNATKKTYDHRRFALIKGAVKDSNDAPLNGVTVSVGANACIQCHGQEYGTVETDPNGEFTIPVEGGSNMVVVYKKPGLITSHRQVFVPWNDIAVVETIQMIPVDTVATTVTFARRSTAVFTHKSTPVIDTFGSRSLTMVFQGDNRAYEVDAGGSVIRELSTVTVRGTEYTTPKSMPAVLPPSSGYTYCAEMSIDGVERIKFDKPVVSWAENFLGFPVGEAVPVGYYDRDKGQWIPTDNGIVVRLLDTNADGIVDALDANTDGLPDDLDGDSSFSDEVLGLVDPVKYPPDSTFWRFSVTHFTPWDCNWPYGPPTNAITPNPESKPMVDRICEDSDSPCCKPRSRVTHVDIPIPGTNQSLHYSSDRVEGYKTQFTVPVSGPNVPSSLKNILVKVSVSGRTLEATLPPLPNQKQVLGWDGRDHLGRDASGSIDARVSIGFVYDGVYYASGDGAQSFAEAGKYVTAVPARQEVILWKHSDLKVLMPPKKGLGIGSGWDLSEHHLLGLDTLFKGSGNALRFNTMVIKTIGGGGGSLEEGIPATEARLVPYYASLAVDAEGNIYFAELNNHRVRKIDTNGIVTTVAGTGVAGNQGDGGLAINARLNTPRDVAVDDAGNIYIAEWYSYRVRKVDSNGIITTVAGNGTQGYSGDGGLATDAQLPGIAVAVSKEGNLFISSGSHIRKVSPTGIITTYAGKHIPIDGGYSGDGGLATNALFSKGIDDIEVDNMGNLYIFDSGNSRIRKVDTQGIVTTVAGNGIFSYQINGDGGPATSVALGRIWGIDVDDEGALYIGGDGRIRKVGTDGIINTVAGGPYTIDGGIDFTPALNATINPTDTAIVGDGSMYIIGSEIKHIYLPKPLQSITLSGERPFVDSNGLGYIISNEGLHKRTIDLETGATLLEFGYNVVGYLVNVTDRFNNTTTINRDPSGVPTSIFSSDGLTTQMIFDANKQLSRITFPDNSFYEFEYSSDGLMTALIDPKNNRFERAYDTGGRLTDVYDQEFGHWNYVRTTFANGSEQVQKTSAEGNTATYLEHTDSTGTRNLTITGPNIGVTYSRSEDSLDESKSLSCGTDLATTYDLDPQYLYRYIKGSTVSTPAGLTQNTQHNKNYQDTNSDGTPDLVTETITVNDKAWTHTNNILLAQKTVTSPEGRTVTAHYNVANLLTSRLTAPGLYATNYSYDTKGRLTSITQDARQSIFAYTVNGFLDSVTESASGTQTRTTSYVYDGLGRVTGILRPDNSLVSFTYDNNGNMSMLTNPLTVNHGFSYNKVNKKTGYQTPLSGSYQYLYDRDRRLTDITFPSGRKIINIYSSGRLSQTKTPEGDIDFSYLSATKLGSMSKGSEALSYTYDGKLVTAETTVGTLSQTLGYVYNNDLNVTGFTYAAGTENYVYDNDGLLTGAGSFTLARDAANGLPKTVSGGTYSLTRSFSGYGEVAGETTTIGGMNRFAYSLSRSVAGWITGKTETVGGASVNYSYNYDDLGRLLTVNKDGALVEEYRYDGVGRRTYEMNTARGIVGRSSSYSDEDHLISAGQANYQYDLDGFLTTKTDLAGITAYNYSSRGELLNVVLPDSKIIEYLHDPQGRRIAKKVNGVIVEKYLWQGLTRLLAVYNGSNALVMRFQYADGRMPVTMTNESATYYLGYDQVGSLRLVTDSNGNAVKQVDYDSFGNILTDSNPTFTIPFGFAGGLHDRDINLVRFGFRDYDPETGRWTAKDPIGFAGGDVDLWGYVQNNPVNWTDPFGLEVYICGRPADLPFPANLANHEWLMTDTKEAGLGAVAGQIPAQNGNSNLPGVPVQVVDHTGQFDAENSSCEYVPTADEGCVNNELVPGRNLGTWGATNNCQTFVNDVINKCTK